MRVGEKSEISRSGPIWKNLGPRLITALIFAAICIIPLYFGGFLWALLVALIGSRMLWEWVRMSDPHPTSLSYLIPILGLIVTVLAFLKPSLNGALFTLAITGLLVGWEGRQRAGFIWPSCGFLYILIPCLFIISIRGNEIGFEAPGFLKILFLVLIVIAADTGAYFGGSYFKGPKLAPTLSPKKTWSGLFSGLCGGIIVGAISAKLIGFSPLYGAGLAIPIVFLSVLGDFLESGLKRRLRVKDAGGLLPGHGGFLDRLDSLMLVVVVAGLVFHYYPGLWPLS